jgi:tyrosyl-tRNA synthetase
MQGWDSVMVRADIEIGGTDQTFNLLVGRDLQRTAGQPGQIALTLPLLVGLDGVQKMSKSLGNHVGIAEPPEEIFGKLMSISDTLMERYGVLLLGDDPEWAARKDAHPLERKKALASALVARFHGEGEAARAQIYFEERFQRRADFAPTPVVMRTAESEVWICKLLKEIGFAASTSAARRLASEGAVRVDGAIVGADYQFKRGVDHLVSVGRRRIAAVSFEEPTSDGSSD